MPRKLPKPCTQPGCKALSVDGSGRCPAHPKPKWAKRSDATKRITGRTLQRLRERLFSAEPLCAECSRQGRVAEATERDHIIPLSEGGEDIESNVQGLCLSCHEAKSKAERLRAIKRGRRG